MNGRAFLGLGMLVVVAFALSKLSGLINGREPPAPVPPRPEFTEAEIARPRSSVEIANAQRSQWLAEFERNRNIEIARKNHKEAELLKRLAETRYRIQDMQRDLRERPDAAAAAATRAALAIEVAQAEFDENAIRQERAEREEEEALLEQGMTFEAKVMGPRMHNMREKFQIAYEGFRSSVISVIDASGPAIANIQRRDIAIRRMAVDEGKVLEIVNSIINMAREFPVFKRRVIERQGAPTSEGLREGLTGPVQMVSFANAVTMIGQETFEEGRYPEVANMIREIAAAAKTHHVRRRERADAKEQERQARVVNRVIRQPTEHRAQLPSGGWWNSNTTNGAGDWIVAANGSHVRSPDGGALRHNGPCVTERGNSGFWNRVSNNCHPARCQVQYDGRCTSP